MSDKTFTSNGACLCGKVSYRATLKTSAGACHCRMCRHWSGGPYMAVHAVGNVDFTGEDNLTVYNSSPWAARGFCKHCGASMFYRLLPRPGLPEGEYMMAAGSIEDQSKLEFDNEVFVDQSPGWYQFTDEQARSRLTEAQIMAMYGADSD